MKWKIKPEPKLGDTRWVKKFAWLPMPTKHSEMLWLESYYVKQVMCLKQAVGDDAGGCYKYLGWKNTGAVTAQEYTKLMQEEQFLTAVSESGDFTLSEATKAYEGVSRYELSPEQQAGLSTSVKELKSGSALAFLQRAGLVDDNGNAIQQIKD